MNIAKKHYSAIAIACWRYFPTDRSGGETLAYIEKLRELAVTDSLLYRRGNFNGSSDQLILDASPAAKGAEIAFSPDFRWGATLLPGESRDRVTPP
jgi:hypothetical protein